ncbi:hypothetical protein FDI24_gp088 [Acidovorax phage ACP17]|uniref:Uncharacterized protein n=1 Tax=Acidovorax phage ACP17 TaxID=2010329 RepID=A0A218M2U1_9CAUD|nr:hypothetical protein FDI24_gp088 [Acidovorax phage ACP17]ASD50367.1 hypothetical protein [Acidovorax phage ACP17]
MSKLNAYLRSLLNEASYPSRFAIGEPVMFSADLNDPSVGSPSGPSLALLCKVVAVKFDGPKVLYDLAVADPQSETGFYEVLPLCNVDSYFVYPFRTPGT